MKISSSDHSLWNGSHHPLPFYHRTSTHRIVNMLQRFTEIVFKLFRKELLKIMSVRSMAATSRSRDELFETNTL